MNKLLARIKVVLTALPTYLVTLSAILVGLAPTIGDMFPGHADTIATWVVRIVAVLAGAVEIIRKVTPVIPSQVGLLPAKKPAHHAAPHHPKQGA